MLYLFVKHTHITLVIITICLFNIRFWMKFSQPFQPLPKLLKIIPHLNDTVLLFTGLWLMNLGHWIPFGNAPWLGFKLFCVVGYIVAGFVALKATPRSVKSVIGYLIAMMCVGSIVYLAYYKPYWG